MSDGFVMDFSGGESERLPAERIGPTESAQVLNAVIRDTVVRALDTIRTVRQAAAGTLSVQVVSDGTVLEFPEAGVSGGEWSGWFYWASATNTGRPRKRRLADGTTQTLGIDGPTVAPTVALTTGTLTLALGTQYTYTFFNTLDGSESFQAPLSAMVTPAGQGVLLPTITTSDPQVTHVNWYRTSDEYVMQVCAVPVGTMTIDSTPSTELGAPLASVNHNPPPVDNDGMAGPYLGIFFLWQGKRLRWCVQHKPDAWPEHYYRDFPQAIRAVVVMGHLGVCVLTAGGVHVLSGTSETALACEDADTTVGCVDGRTAKYTPYGVMFVSPLGVALYAGGKVQHLTRYKTRDTFGVAPRASFADDQYRLFQDGTVRIIDCVRWPSVVVSRGDYAVSGPTLGVCEGGGSTFFLHAAAGVTTIAEWCPEPPAEPIPLRYSVTTRAWFPKNPINVLHAREVALEYAGALTVEVWADGVRQHTEVCPRHPGRARHAFFTPHSIWGRLLQLVCTGDGTLYHAGLRGVEEKGK